MTCYARVYKFIGKNHHFLKDFLDHSSRGHVFASKSILIAGKYIVDQSIYLEYGEITPLHNEVWLISQLIQI